MTTNWVYAGVAASCKDKSVQFLGRTKEHQTHSSFAFSLVEELMGYQLVTQFIPASVSICVFLR